MTPADPQEAEMAETKPPCRDYDPMLKLHGCELD